MQSTGHFRIPDTTNRSAGHSKQYLFGFARFIPLPENRSALAAVAELAECLPDVVVNPVFVHGPPGSGKSFLVSALVEQAAAFEVGVLSANAFPLPWDQNEPTAAERYEEACGCDLLIVEDLQHLPAHKRNAGADAG